MVTKVALLDTHNLPTRKKVGFLELDVVMNETITLNNTVTTAPIETGERVADHIYNEPLELSMDCIISQSDPLRSLTGQGLRTTRIEAYETLLDLWKAKSPIDVVAGYEVYTSMLVTSISIPRSNEDGDSIRFAVNMVQANILPSVFLSDRAGRVSLGRKQPVELSASLTGRATQAAGRVSA